MRRSSALLSAACIVGIALGLLVSPALRAQSVPDDEPVVTEELVRRQLKTAEGRQATLVRGRLAPGAAMAVEPTIEHPAEEFVYVVDGTATLTRAGDEPLRFETGDAWYNDPGQAHTLENASRSEPLMVVAVWIGEEGAF